MNEVTVKHVYTAIAEVMAKLSKEGIAKDRNNQSQGYKFRGIDDVYNALAPHLSAAGLCILPNVLEREVVERQSAKGGALFYVTVKVEFSFVSAKDGSEHKVTVYGEAMDSGDKATNKAMSAAFKYACMEGFCIPTEGDNDADTETHEVAPKVVISKDEKDKFYTQMLECLEMNDEAGVQQLWAEWDTDQKVILWGLFNSQQRAAMKVLMGVKCART